MTCQVSRLHRLPERYEIGTVELREDLQMSLHVRGLTPGLRLIEEQIHEWRKLLTVFSCQEMRQGLTDLGRQATESYEARTAMEG